MAIFDDEDDRTKMHDSETAKVWSHAINVTSTTTLPISCNDSCIRVHSKAEELLSRRIAAPTHDIEWTLTTIDATSATVIAAGQRNQYASELPPGASVSCMRSSLAFLRAVFLYGIEASTSANAIDGLLYQGIEWTVASTPSGSVPRTCDPQELPRVLLGSEDGSVAPIVVALSKTYGELNFYAKDGCFRPLDTQMSAREFFQTIWKDKINSLGESSRSGTQLSEDSSGTEKICTVQDTKLSYGSGTLFCIFIVGVTGIGVAISGKQAFIFDPHGHGREESAFIVRLPCDELYKYLTSYADPADDPLWSGTFVYFLSAISNEIAISASEEDVSSAVSRSYGTTDVAYEDRSLPDSSMAGKLRKGAFVADVRYEPPLRPDVAMVSKAIIGLKAIETKSDQSFNTSDIEIISSDESGNEEQMDSETLTTHVSSERPVDSSLWTSALETRPDAQSGTVKRADPLSPSPPQKRMKEKRRRPVWTPPSSSENLAITSLSEITCGIGNKRTQKTHRKYRKKPYYSGSSEKLASIIVSDETPNGTTPIHDVQYAPSAVNSANRNSVGMQEDTPPEPIPTTLTEIKRQSGSLFRPAADAMRNRKPYNPHVAMSVNYGPEGLWSDEFLENLSLTGIRDKIRDMTAGATAALDTSVSIVGSITGNPNDKNLLKLYAISTYERLVAFLLENGTRSTPETPSIVADELKVLVNSIPSGTAFLSFLAACEMCLSEIIIHVELFRQARSEDSRSAQLAFFKLASVARDVDAATVEFKAVLDKIEASMGSADFGYEQLTSEIVSSLESEKCAKTGALYAESQIIDAQTGNVTTETLSERLTRICSAINGIEEEYRRDCEIVRKELESIDAGVRYMARTLDSYVPGGGLDDNTSPTDEIQCGSLINPGVGLTRDGVNEILSNIYKGAETAIGDAVREYYSRVALFSAKAALSDKHSAEDVKRFSLIRNSSLEGLTRMANSLRMLDTSFLNVTEMSPGTNSLPKIACGPIGSIFSGLIETGNDLSTDEKLDAWFALWTSAKSERLIDRKELDILEEKIMKINRIAASIETAGATALKTFKAALETAAQHYGAEESADEVAVSALIAQLEDVRRAYTTLQKIDPIAAAECAPAAKESALILEKATIRAADLREAAKTARDAIVGMLRPLKDFIGLRALGSTSEDLKRRLTTIIGKNVIPESSSGYDIFTAIIKTSPAELLGQLKSDLMTLLSQYRLMLDRPSHSTASSLLGLGPPFAFAIKLILDHIGGYPEALQFFSRHADTVAMAVSDAYCHPDNVSKAKIAATALRIAANDILRVPADGMSELGTFADGEDSTLSGRNTFFAFLNVLAMRYEEMASLREREIEVKTAVDNLRAVGETVTRNFGRVRNSDQTSGLSQELTAQSARAIVDAETAIYAGTEILAKERSQEVAVSDIDNLSKSISSVKTRIDELKNAIAAHEKNLSTFMTARAEAEWRSDSEKLLSAAMEKSEFDPAKTHKLVEVGRLNNFSQLPAVHKKASDVLKMHRDAVLQAIENVLKFNPYDPENLRNNAVPPMSAVKDLTWGDSFIAVSSSFSELFGGVDVAPLVSALGAASIVSAYGEKSASGYDPSDYRAMISVLERDPKALPFLSKYSDFYRRGRDEYELLVDRFAEIRTTVSHASGRLPTELNAALTQVASIRSADVAKTTLERGVKIKISAIDAIVDAINKLEAEDISPYSGTAYEKAVKRNLEKELSNAKASEKTANEAIAIAEERAVQILQEVAAAGDAADKEMVEGLANLKNLLRLVSPPTHATKALDAARSVDDIVTQLALLLARAEETDELDSQTIEWLVHARSVIDSHPVSTLIDETGPATPYAERINALSNLRTEVDALRGAILSADAEWDEAWSFFVRDKEKALKSYEGASAARRSACRLESATNLILALRAHHAYPRLPAKLIANIEAKRIEREAATSVTVETLDRLEQDNRALTSLLDRVPGMFSVDDLRSAAKRCDELLSRLPKWYGELTSRYRLLITMRLGLYAGYMNIKNFDIEEAPRPELFETLQLSESKLQWQKSSRDLARVAAWMGSGKAVTTLREVISDIDYPIDTTFLDANQVPLRYSICYNGATDKIAAALCEPQLFRSTLPALPREPIVIIGTEDAASILSEIIAIRLEYTNIAIKEFDDYARYVRLKRPPWPASENRRATTEIYTALIATTLTRMENANWADIHAFPALALSDDNVPWITAKRDEIKIGIRKSADREIRMDPGDLITALISRAPGHFNGFSKLDLKEQHLFMADTIYRFLEDALCMSTFINCLHSPDNKFSVKWRPLSLNGGKYDPSGGSLFTILYDEWAEGPLSNSDPLKPWEKLGESVVDNLNKIRQLIKSNDRLLALTVLARACIPPTALMAMWTSMGPDASTVERPILSFDDILIARADAASHLKVTDSNTEVKGTIDPEPLYKPTGKVSSFTVVSAPPTLVTRVNAVDIAIAGTLFGAPLVVAAECPGAYSAESGLSLCIKLFDSRSNATSSFIDHSAISTDLTSWGTLLLAADDNIIENACLTTQLESLSAMLASKPLASAPPCLIIVREDMTLKSVLWAKSVPEPPPVIRLKFTSDLIIDELPYIDVQSKGIDTGMYDNLMDPKDVSRVMAIGNRGYPNPIYETASAPLPVSDEESNAQYLDSKHSANKTGFPPLPESPSITSEELSDFDTIDKRLVSRIGDSTIDTETALISDVSGGDNMGVKEFNKNASQPVESHPASDAVPNMRFLSNEESQPYENPYETNVDRYGLTGHEHEKLIIQNDEYIDDVPFIVRETFHNNRKSYKNKPRSSVRTPRVDFTRKSMLIDKPKLAAWDSMGYRPSIKKSAISGYDVRESDYTVKDELRRNDSVANILRVLNIDESDTDFTDEPISMNDELLNTVHLNRIDQNESSSESYSDSESTEDSLSVKSYINTFHKTSSPQKSTFVVDPDRVFKETSRRTATTSKLTKNRNRRIGCYDALKLGSDRLLINERLDCHDELTSYKQSRARECVPDSDSDETDYERWERSMRLKGYDTGSIDYSGGSENFPLKKSPERLIKTDDLLHKSGRRKFREASRGAMYYLMRACNEIAGRINAIKDQLVREAFDIYVELAKIRMLLISDSP